MTIEDSWGGDIVTAAIAHLAHSTPPEFLFSATDFNSYVTRSIAPDAPRRQGGRLAAGTAPGLGVTPDSRPARRARCSRCSGRWPGTRRPRYVGAMIGAHRFARCAAAAARLAVAVGGHRRWPPAPASAVVNALTPRSGYTVERDLSLRAGRAAAAGPVRARRCRRRRADPGVLLRRQLAERVEGALPLRGPGLRLARLRHRDPGLSRLPGGPLPDVHRGWGARGQLAGGAAGDGRRAPGIPRRPFRRRLHRGDAGARSALAGRVGPAAAAAGGSRPWPGSPGPTISCRCATPRSWRSSAPGRRARIRSRSTMWRPATRRCCWRPAPRTAPCARATASPWPSGWSAAGVTAELIEYPGLGHIRDRGGPGGTFALPGAGAGRCRRLPPSPAGLRLG